MAANTDGTSLSHEVEELATKFMSLNGEGMKIAFQQGEILEQVHEQVDKGQWQKFCRRISWSKRHADRLRLFYTKHRKQVKADASWFDKQTLPWTSMLASTGDNSGHDSQNKRGVKFYKDVCSELLGQSAAEFDGSVAEMVDAIRTKVMEARFQKEAA